MQNLRKEIVDSFFLKGKLLTPEALSYLETRGPKDAADWQCLVIDIEDIMAKEDKIRIILNITGKKTEITTSDMVKFYNSKYQKMKNIITSRLAKNFISINKLDQARGEVFVIGIIREIADNGDKINLDIEDSTGSVTAVFDKGSVEDAELDDVVAVQGNISGKFISGSKILYPDMPLREPATATGKACFISDLCLDEAPKKDFENFLKWFETKDINYLFITGKIGDLNALGELVDSYCRSKKVIVCQGSSGEPPDLPPQSSSNSIIFLSNPSITSINSLKILCYDKFLPKMLKKRHLTNIKPYIEEDLMALEDLPDIVHCAGESASVSNYKSTTIINSGSLLSDFRPVVVDFLTRECKILTPDEMRMQG
jgi:DNA polymerase II small subunit/DNA polymerase delta subunit B